MSPQCLGSLSLSEPWVLKLLSLSLIWWSPCLRQCWLCRGWACGSISWTQGHRQWLSLWVQATSFNMLLSAINLASLVAHMVKNLPAMQEIRVWSLGWEDPLEGHGYTLQYSCLENPMDHGTGGLQSMGSQRVGHDWAINTHTVINFIIWSFFSLTLFLDWVHSTLISNGHISWCVQAAIMK